MVSINLCVLAGHLTADPELKSSNGTNWCRFRLAVNSKSKDGKEETLFISILAFGPTADATAKYLTKGSPAIVEGRLQLREWQSDDGAKHSEIRLLAHRVHFLSAKPRE